MQESKQSVYKSIILDIFRSHLKAERVSQRVIAPGDEFVFDRSEILASADRLNLKAPKNLGDLIYCFRYRRPLPQPILDTQPKGFGWMILGAGDGRYRFRLGKIVNIAPSANKFVRKIPDNTPEIISKYSLNDEQAVLARIRYNRLIDIFLGIAAFPLQSHLRTKIENYGQIEIDELYVGIDSFGVQYIVPVQAKTSTDTIGAIQAIQDTIFCRTHELFKLCMARPIAAQSIDAKTIALFELNYDGNDVSIVQEQHYRLVESSEITERDMTSYRASRSGIEDSIQRTES